MMFLGFEDILFREIEDEVCKETFLLVESHFVESLKIRKERWGKKIVKMEPSLHSCVENSARQSWNCDEF